MVPGPSPATRRITGALVLLVAGCILSAHAAPPVQWAGQGPFRILVSVPAHPIGDRAFDDRPASFEVDFGEILTQLRASGQADPASIQVIRHDPATGKPLSSASFAFGKSPDDVPFRFDQVDPRPHWWLYSLLGDGQQGRLTWLHRQQGNQASQYGIYFSTVPQSYTPGTPPRGWIGDGDAVFQERGLLPSLLHTRPYPFDWDDDGKLDLIVGFIRGYLFLYRNVGSAEEPSFQGPYFIAADGEPLKVPWYSAPRMVDWNGDGLPDLILGHDPRGSVRYYENVGTRKAPKLADRGPIKADGVEITCPHEPVPEAPGVFKKDYTGVPEVVDWDGDGDLDLLMGGYVTGRIFYFENVGKAEDGTPILAGRGPLEADGEIFDVAWQASPTAADIDGDGLLELISGTMYMSPSGGEGAPPDWPGFFMIENRGTKAEPVLAKVPFPLKGEWQETQLLNPRFADWDGDGLLDVVVGAGTSLMVYRNVGTATEPLFQRQEPLTVAWVPHLAHPDWTGDLDGDGRLDMLQAHGGGTVEMRSVTGAANPPRFANSRVIRTAAGSDMCKPPKHGDPWAAAVGVDFDGDADTDILVGDVAGYVWYYANTGTLAEPAYAEGVQLLLESGKPLYAGIDPDAEVTDFTVLQGNRAVPACADFSGDGNRDLVIGDATGGLTYFENAGTNAEPRFATGRELARLSGRIHVATTDLNGDGVPDLVVSQVGAGAGNQLLLVETQRVDGQPAWTFPGTPIPLAWIPYPQPSVSDANGDGDEDVVIGSSYSTVYLAERSFINHGVAEATVLGTERR